jgi:integrase
MAGTRTFEIAIKFVRMTFREFGKTHPRWLNPFQSIDAPKAMDGNPRDILDDNEVIKLFSSNAFNDKMEKAVCAAMYWAGLRRSEIFALRPENLDWKTPKIRIENAWKNFDRKDRELGDPKCHRKREVPFPIQLQEAIQELWEDQGRHEFVFAWKKDVMKNPGASSWVSSFCKVWILCGGLYP